jgi:hypothetical protein
VWQRVWDDRSRSFHLLGVAVEAQGDKYVRPFVAEQGTVFPVLVDRSGALGAALSFRMVPSGFFVSPDGIISYRHVDDFDIADPRVRWNLERFLDNQPLESPDDEAPMQPEAMELFALGVSRYDERHASEALTLWRRALKLDPSNFLIRSQIWAAEHPERFYPVVDLDWQQLQLVKEGYSNATVDNAIDHGCQRHGTA